MTTALGVPVRTAIASERGVIAIAAVTLAAAWWTLATQSHPQPGAGAGMLFAAAVWMVMMLAMMLPVVTPWLSTFTTLNRRRRHEGSKPLVSTGLFAAGYFAAWALFSVAAAGLQTVFAPAIIPTHWGALALVGAGLYQFSGLKTACLDHCRSPLGYLLAHWGSGRPWALGLGLRHGLYCLGCCWALMGLSFVLGVMNLAWMAAVTLMLCVEAMAPGGKHWSRVFGVVLVCWGLSNWAA